MPSKSKPQRNLMKMCSTTGGRKYAKSKGVKCPPKKVAAEFRRADKRKGK